MLKWCEIKTRASYCAFREGGSREWRQAKVWGPASIGLWPPHHGRRCPTGEQLLYQLPNNKLLTTKIGLLSVLREYSRSSSKVCKTLLSAQAR